MPLGRERYGHPRCRPPARPKERTAAPGPSPAPCGGPQNSLTGWRDEGDGAELLADYGNVWSFMLFLRDRYGDKILRALHRDAQRQGLASLQAQLDRVAKGTSVTEVIGDFQLMNLLDAVVDVRGGKVSGIAKGRVSSASLDVIVNLANPAAYALPGGAPNGADYLVLRRGKATSGGAPRSIEFAGVDTDALDRPVEGWRFALVGLDRARHRALVRSMAGSPRQ